MEPIGAVVHLPDAGLLAVPLGEAFPLPIPLGLIAASSVHRHISTSRIAVGHRENGLVEGEVALHLRNYCGRS